MSDFNPLEFKGTRWFDDIEFRPWIEVDRNKLGRVTVRHDSKIDLPLREFQIDRLLTETQAIVQKNKFEEAMADFWRTVRRVLFLQEKGLVRK